MYMGLYIGAIYIHVDMCVCVCVCVYVCVYKWASLVAQMIKNLLALQETWV